MEMNIRKSKGLTLIGFVIVLAVVLFFAYAGMRVIPMYLEYQALISAMDKLNNMIGLDDVKTQRQSAEHEAVAVPHHAVRRERLVLPGVRGRRTADDHGAGPAESLITLKK